jgi:hypothetical protein
VSTFRIWSTDDTSGRVRLASVRCADNEDEAIAAYLAEERWVPGRTYRAERVTRSRRDVRTRDNVE